MCGITIYKNMYRCDYHKIIIWKFGEEEVRNGEIKSASESWQFSVSTDHVYSMLI